MKRLTLYIATVNQTGTLDKGHYIAYVKLSNSSFWQFCNIPTVLRSSVEKVKDTSFAFAKPLK